MRTGAVVTEVRMSQGSLGGDPGLGIKHQHFLNKNETDQFQQLLCERKYTSSKSRANGSISGTRSWRFLG